MDLEMMRLELIPFSVNAESVIADWPEEKQRRFFRKFRKIARKAALHTAIREDNSYGSGSHAERKTWIKRRTDFLFNPPSPTFSPRFNSAIHRQASPALALWKTSQRGQELDAP